MTTAGFLALAGCMLWADPEPLERLGTLADPALREVSGIVRSRRHDGIFWVLNDSGNAPELFAVKRDGSLVQSFRVAAPNVDWEDIATDDAGHLYIGEIGNNNNLLPLRAIYRVDEPDPKGPHDAPLAVTFSTFYKFPKDGRFDAESLFLLDGRAVVVAKTFDEREAELYAIPLDPPAPLLRPALPLRLGSLPGFREPATGANLSPDGRFLAVCSSQVTRVYDRNPDGGWSLVGQFRYKADQFEAICWDGTDLILASEGRGIFRASESCWKGQRKQSRDRIK
jgi:hypothetical protein